MAGDTSTDWSMSEKEDTALVKDEMRDKVFALQREMLKLDGVYVRGGKLDANELCPITHHFSKGVYGREMFIPKGVVLIGEIHKYSQFNIMSKGDLSVVVGDEVHRLKAPCSFVAPPGAKRVMYAHEDSIWTVIHGTDETDLEKIEAHFIAKDEQDYLVFCRLLEEKEKEKEKTCLG